MLRYQSVRALRLLSTAVLLTGTMAMAQDKPAPADTPPAKQPTTTLHTSTQLVIVDVTVTDSSGKPVHGLTRDNFRIAEGKNAQALRNFEEHSSATALQNAMKLPPMPPGTFTDYVPVRPGAPLNIVLLDTLNTPMKDQSFVRDQLKQYVKNAPTGAQIAIFGMSNKLTILQGFTTDPSVLKDAVEHKLIPRGSSLLDDAVGTNADPMNLSDTVSDMTAGASGAMASSLNMVAANLAQFEAETASFQLQLRMQYTLDAFNQLARYLATYPGRKNVIWFSGSFPLNIMPDETLTNPFSVMAGAEDEYREVSNLLTRSQVAVYPVDARGLMVAPMFDAANSGRKYARNPSAFLNDQNKFSQSQFDEHTTMERMATDTGGHAFYNTNGLAQAVSQAVESGANYYTLTYSPTDHNWNGAYRNIHVDVTGAPASNLRLAYRHGYYADDPDHIIHGATSAATTTDDASAPNRAALGYIRAAMSRGAPAPSDVLFKVRVLPASTVTEASVAPGNVLEPTGKLKGPFRRYVVDFAALASTIQWSVQPDGIRRGTTTFEVLVFDPDGKLLNSVTQSLKFNMPPEIYKVLLQRGVDVHLEVSAPAKGETYLRLLVHDGNANHFGVVEIPTSSVARLQPPPPPPAAAAPATPSTPATSPSTATQQAPH